MTLAQALRALRKPLLADGRIDVAETAVLLRALRPHVLNGDPDAVSLERDLLRMREDGVITKAESDTIAARLERLAGDVLSLSRYVRAIPDFPKPGVLFRDVTSILEITTAFRLAVGEMEQSLDGVSVDLVAAPESRGFIFGAALADRLRTAFVPIRKPGKLPRETISETYALEYGQATLHMHKDAVIRGERAVIVDDLLATGGTAVASARLVERLGGKVVKMIFPIELEGFGAKTGALKDYDVVSLVRFPGK